jgi:ferrochelatase
VGVVLLNVGSPDAPTPAALRRYLRDFLSDGRVLDMHPWRRWLLVHGIIAPLRAPRSAAAYRAVWTADGSPLLLHTRALADALAARLAAPVGVGMAVGSPSIESALDGLPQSLDRVVLVPMFPQMASATTGAVLERALRHLSARTIIPAISTMAPFYDTPGFIDAQRTILQAAIADFAPEHLLLSFHGLPERHLRRIHPGLTCAPDAPCPAIGEGTAHCYRAQCYATARALGPSLGVPYSVGFQSRLGRDRWIGPDTIAVASALRRRGVRRLLVSTPAFAADCLETLEEIGIRLRDSWLAQGGEAFHLAPCLNAAPCWADALAEKVRAVAGGPPAHTQEWGPLAADLRGLA